MTIRAPLLMLSALLAGCSSQPSSPLASATPLPTDWRSSEHRIDDDLLSAGLGLAGLRAATPPPVAVPEAPTAAELRRRAIWSNWRGIADLAVGGGLGEFYGEFGPVPGREFHALRWLPGATHPHRVMLQLPDGFDRSRRCLVVTASSGSRGIYGAIALAGGWGLPRGCAIAYTDKGAGTGWFDSVALRGARLDGTPGAPGDGLEFAPSVAADSSPVLVKHLHSGDNPEADWGRHLQQAAQFAIDVLDATRLPDEPGYAFSNVQVLATGVSNGAGAVLRAAELKDGWLDGVVAVSPNLHVAAARPLYDIASEAALLMPCALVAAAFDSEPLARPGGGTPPAWAARCARLRDDRLISGDTLQQQAADALRQLQAGGWTDPALAAATLSVGFDVWRAVTAGYAAAYARSGNGPMPCGYAYAVLDGALRPRPPSAAEQALWWSDSNGIPPGAGVQLIERAAATGDDPAYPGLRCLRALWSGDDAAAARLRAGVDATRAGLPAAGLPVLVMHGADDGLVPERHSSAAYVAAGRDAGRPLRYWRIHHAQHFDAFLGLPALAPRYVPLLPYAWHGLDLMWRHIAEQQPLPVDAEIRPGLRGTAANEVAPLHRRDLKLP